MTDFTMYEPLVDEPRQRELKEMVGALGGVIIWHASSVFCCCEIENHSRCLAEELRDKFKKIQESRDTLS